jgi:hypothetical protein
VVGEIPLYVYVLIERFFDGTDKENSKTRGKGNNGGKKKKRFFTYGEDPILVYSLSVRNALGPALLCDPPSGGPTHMGTSPTT